MQTIALLLHNETLGSYHSAKWAQATVNDLWEGCATKLELLSDVLGAQDSRETALGFFLSKVSISMSEMFMLLFYF